MLVLLGVGRQPTELAWQILTVCIQCWDTPDDGQWTCPKHVEYFIKYTWEIVHLVGFRYKNTSRCAVLWMSKNYPVYEGLRHKKWPVHTLYCTEALAGRHYLKPISTLQAVSCLRCCRTSRGKPIGRTVLHDKHIIKDSVQGQSYKYLWIIIFKKKKESTQRSKDK